MGATQAIRLITQVGTKEGWDIYYASMQRRVVYMRGGREMLGSRVERKRGREARVRRERQSLSWGRRGYRSRRDRAK